MARTNKRKPLAWLCFASTGGSHNDCVNEPFQNDAGIWIGFRNSPDESYKEAMTFCEVLAQAEQNLIKAHQAKPGRERAEWLEVFPGVTTKVKQDIVEQLQLGKRAFEKAHRQHAACKKISEPLRMEWLSITYRAPEATQSTQGFIAGFVFNLRGQEMIVICRNYHLALYRFQRQDGSVSPEMALGTASDEKHTKAKSLNPVATASHENKSRRQSRRLQASRSHMDESPVAGSQYDAGEGPAEASPAASTTHDVDMLEGSMPSTDDTGEAEAEEELQSPNASTTHDFDTGNTEADEEVQSSDTFAPGSTRDEHEAMIVQITYTYGVRILTSPHVSAYIGLLGEAVRQDNRLALCQAFGRLQTILLKSGNSAAADVLDEEYEELVSSVVLDHGMEVLSTTEGKTFMEDMGKAMIRGYREGLCGAYAALRTCMAAYGRRSELEDEN
ncbi:hypothetical protein D6D01_06980 [Aureobasidium pullulans]|uniref:Uncharacterized protein n=1 Tax=Aureobasidium pullulans TaxID=5580 RepID=A0A4S9KTT2_AURPU|nr:hypothetical protein D6D01_06980 [Aureobasidium pullulans]